MKKYRNNDLKWERLVSLLHYDPETGHFHWKVNRGKHRNMAGRRTGRPSARSGQGYGYVCVDGVVYRANRLAWFYCHKTWPEGEVDHKNGDRGDDRLANLRDVPAAAQQQNMKLDRKNSSGYPGTYLHSSGLYGARIEVNRKRINLGYFKDRAAASEAYLRAKKEHHPFWARGKEDE